MRLTRDSARQAVKYSDWYCDIPFRLDSWRIERQMDALRVAMKTAVEALAASCQTQSGDKPCE